ncbi:hypothetical protein BU16DRAFT_536800 [Lophium mytilinum]|uniref:Uncharacterized protein n=1 Tax=Lophium mytilinum TaxID=390894 RepID=A0A6A6R2N2_9PEZI|nr:hypothetical protein BU16DRAFT_536800 [Lophium mytilinum]
MTLSARYQRFLASPSAGALADSAAIHYITTLVTVNDAAGIVKHLSAQDKQLKKKGEKVLSSIESSNGLCVDVETTIEFISGGGAYLPGLDDNFLSDRLVTFPVVHIVQFDAQRQIEQIRLYWDQGSLLKQIDVIGARARNWPIRDGKDQTRLIALSAAAAGSPPPSAASSRRSTASKGSGLVETSGNIRAGSREGRSRSSVSATGDPHASLSLFQPRDVNAQTESYNKPNAPRATSAKPPPREWSELFAGEENAAPSPAQSAAYSSPRKNGIPAKAGAGKNFKPSRLFEEDEDAAHTPIKERGIKTNKQKYNHFNIGDPEDDTPKAAVKTSPVGKSKHQSQWDFEDFVTPEKVKEKIPAQAVRHFGWSDDEDVESPVKRPIVHKARPMDPHFQFDDTNTPAADKKKHVSGKGTLQNAGMGLYRDHVVHQAEDDGFEDDDMPVSRGDNKRSLGDVTHTINNEIRKKDFGPQWEMRDDSPIAAKVAPAGENGKGLAERKAPIERHQTEDRKAQIKGLESHWGLYEDSPEQAKKENIKFSKERGIKSTGDGMGGRKDAGRQWGIGNEGDDYEAVRPKGGKKEEESKGFWDF